MWWENLLLFQDLARAALLLHTLKENKINLLFVIRYSNVAGELHILLFLF
jgi:hypothetical protein